MRAIEHVCTYTHTHTLRHILFVALSNKILLTMHNLEIFIMTDENGLSWSSWRYSQLVLMKTITTKLCLLVICVEHAIY